MPFGGIECQSRSQSVIMTAPTLSPQATQPPPPPKEPATGKRLDGLSRALTIFFLGLIVLVIVLMLPRPTQPDHSDHSTSPSANVTESGAPSASPEASALPEGAAIEQLQAYGQAHPDEFGGLYVETPGTPVVMLFTANLPEHQQAVQQIRSDTITRQVTYSERDLIAVLDSIDFDELRAEGVELVSIGVDVIDNRVELIVKAPDSSVAERLAAIHGEALDVVVHPPDSAWQNATGGDGWRLLGAGNGPASEASTMRDAANEEEYAVLWANLNSESEPPPVDFATEVVVSFGHGHGSSCPELRLDDVQIEDGLVFDVVSDPLSPRACTADLSGAVIFLVAIERDLLPEDFGEGEAGA